MEIKLYFRRVSKGEKSCRDQFKIKVPLPKPAETEPYYFNTYINTRTEHQWNCKITFTHTKLCKSVNKTTHSQSFRLLCNSQGTTKYCLASWQKTRQDRFVWIFNNC